MTWVSSFLSLSLDSPSQKRAYPCSIKKIKAVKTARCSDNKKRDNIRKKDCCFLGTYNDSPYSVSFSYKRSWDIHECPSMPLSNMFFQFTLIVQLICTLWNDSSAKVQIKFRDGKCCSIMIIGQQDVGKAY